MNSFGTNENETPFASAGKPLPDASSPYVLAVPPVLSSLAIISLIFGLLSPFLLCVCGLSLLSSLVAVVTGHVALVKINNSAGQLTGRGMALVGLLTGYLMLGITVVALCIFLPGLRNDWRVDPQDGDQGGWADSPDASKRLLNAEKNVLIAGADGIATGNSPAAIELARDFSEFMKQMRDVLFTKDDSLVGAITEGNFLTHCELHDGRCAFIVHVPAYNKFDEDAKESLATIGWKVAQGTVKEQLEPGDLLAVGLKGRLIYGAVLIGQVAAEEQEEAIFERRERDDLLSFFPPTYGEPLGATLSADAVTEPAGEKVAEMNGAVANPRLVDGLPDVPRVADVPSVPDVPNIPDGPNVPDGPGVSGDLIPDWVPPVSQPQKPIEASDPVSPDRAPIKPVTQPPSKQTPAKPRAAARSRPKLMDDVPVSKEVVQQFPDMGWAVESLAFAPDGRWLAAGKMDRTLLILDVATGKTLSAANKLDELSGIHEVAFSPDGTSVAAAGSTGAVFSWPIDSAGDLGDAQPLARHGQRVQCLTISPTAPFLMTGSSSGELIWQSYASSTSTSRTLKALPRGALALFLPEQGLEATATDGSNLIRVDLRTAKVSATRKLPRSAAQAAAFSHDGALLAVAAGYKIQIWDTATGLSLGTFDGDREMQWSVAFLPDGKRLISGGRGFATLWSRESGKAECRFDLGGIQYIQTFAVSRDATMLAAIPASAGQTLTVLRIPH